MKANTVKAGHKYIRRKKVKGKWIYDYGKGYPKTETKKAIFKIDDYYAKGRPRYFETKKDLENFKKQQKLGFTSAHLKKIKTSSRIKVGTKVKIKVGEKNFVGKVIKTHKIGVTQGQAPTHFDVEIYDSKSKKTMIKKKVPKERIARESKSYQQKKQQQKTKKQKKADVYKQEGNALLERKMELSPEIQAQAKELMNKNWESFQGIIGKYWRSRINGGWDARKFGFEYEDMKQEIYLTVYRSALSYVSNPRKDGRATFRSYTLNFLKANMAATLAVKSGGGGHLHASGKDQIYLWFFKTTKDKFKDEHNGKNPTDVELMDELNKRRKELSDEKGNMTIKNYPWTLEKVRNKSAMVKRMESLDRVINMGDGRSDTLLSVLNDEELDVAGHYKSDPWQQAQKIIVREEVKKSIEKKFPSASDRLILIRTYGLFVTEDSPLKERIYAEGNTPGEIVDLLNKIEIKRKTKKRWTTGTLNARLVKLLEGLRDDPDFQKRMKAFVKSTLTDDQEWSDIELIFYWITMYNIVSEAIDEFIGDKSIPVNEEVDNNAAIKLLIDKKYGSDTIEGNVSQESKKMGFIKNRHVE